MGTTTASQSSLDRVVPGRAELTGLLTRHRGNAYRAFTGFLLGHLLLEVAAQGVDISPVQGDENTARQPVDPLQGYPMLRRLQPELASEDSREEFDRSLANLLQRLQAAVAGDEHYQQIGALRRPVDDLPT